MKTNKLFILLSLVFLMSAPNSFAQEEGSLKTTVDLLAKGSLGWAHYDDMIYGVLDTRMGVYTDINIASANPISIQTGLEFKSTGYGVKTVFSGLSSSSSDFYEIYYYHINYLGIPIMVKYQDRNNPSSWLNGLFFGFGFNIPLGGNYNWDRYKTGLKSKSVDDSGDGDIPQDKLSSPAGSFRLGFDEKLSDKWGFFMELESIRNVFKTGETSKTIRAFRIGVIYYL